MAWADTKQEFEALMEEFASLKVQLLADGPLPWLARNLTDSDAVNLLQGDYARNTDYEARFTLSDPDGVKGKAVQVAKVHTRAEPMPAAGGKVYHVYPANFKGPKQEPSFKGLLGAYYMRESNSDNSGTDSAI